MNKNLTYLFDAKTKLFFSRKIVDFKKRMKEKRIDSHKVKARVEDRKVNIASVGCFIIYK